MKLSERTILLLKNFQSINNSIVIKAGSTIRTLSPSEAIYAKAETEDEFPRDFGIYDLSKFLGILSLSDDSEIEFQDQHLIIHQGRSKTKYAYCAPDILVHPSYDEEFVLPTEDVVFNLEPDILSKVTKAMSILGFQEIAITGGNGILSIEALKSKDQTANIFSTEIGECDLEFRAIFEAERLKLLPINYEVVLSRAKGSMFRGEGIEYGIALSENSVFN